MLDLAPAVGKDVDQVLETHEITFFVSLCSLQRERERDAKVELAQTKTSELCCIFVALVSCLGGRDTGTGERVEL